jgi:hypothetical protein
MRIEGIPAVVNVLGGLVQWLNLPALKGPIYRSLSAVQKPPTGPILVLNRGRVTVYFAVCKRTSMRQGG